MAKKLSPLERQIYESIQEKIYEKSIKTATEKLRRGRNRKGSSIPKPNITFILKREQYKKLYRLSQTKFLQKHPNVVAKLRRDYEINYGKKLKFVAKGRTVRKVYTPEQKIRKKLLNQKYYYINKQRKLAKKFDQAGFVAGHKGHPSDSLAGQLHQLKHEAKKLGGTRKLTNAQIQEQIEEIKKGVSINYFVNKNNFASEETRMDAVVADFAQHLNDLLKGKGSPELRMLIDQHGSGWYNNSIMDVLQTIHRTDQVEMMSRFYKFDQQGLTERLSEVSLGYTGKKQKQE